MTKRNTEAMVKYNIEKGKANKERVLAAIEQCKKEGNLNRRNVTNLAGVDYSYFSKYPEMAKVLYTAMGIDCGKIKKTKQNSNSKDVLIHTLTAENKKLKKQISKLNDCKKYKDMYEEKCEEVEKLKKQLEEAYRNSNIFDF